MLVNALLTLAGFVSYPVMAEADVPAPHSIVVIGCRVDDHTGEPGRQDPEMAGKGWRDLEWHFNDENQLECKREEIPLEDQTAMQNPTMPELNPDFGDFGQCASVAMSYGPKWEQSNKGWAVMAVGCPTKIVNNDGRIVGWHLPDCPSSVGGLTITCKFDGSLI